MLTLIGDTNTKRTEYFKQAANACQVPVSIIEWNQVNEALCNSELKRAVIKIDPPSYNIVALEEMKLRIAEYQKQLQLLEGTGAAFLNTPQAIWNMLDKRGCKSRLQAVGVPVTEVLLERVKSVEQLLETMQKMHCNAVFLKPVVFSGAAGVTAFRFQPRSGKMQAYTSCKVMHGADKQGEGILVNTKTLYCLEDKEEVLELLDCLLQLDMIAERWYPKASYQGKSYDLRVVYQFGHIAHIVVRQAKGPITNLHLNNQALRIEELQLSSERIEELEILCGQAVAAVPGLSMAGIDILLEKNSGKPYIIEINGQGDLIYQDIYGENRIYREQVERLRCRQSI